MNTAYVRNETSPTPSLLGFLETTMELVPQSPMPPGEKPDSLPIIITLSCIFLLLATCLIFVTLCKPSALDQARYGPHECMPYHPENSSEPQLRFWKRLDSLRRSINSFRRTQPVSQLHQTCSRMPPTTQDWDFIESTKM